MKITLISKQDLKIVTFNIYCFTAITNIYVFFDKTKSKNKINWIETKITNGLIRKAGEKCA